jgi:hypothetical protein
MPRYLISNVLGVVGAVIGGVLGFYIFRWLFGQGFYGLMIPGALLGLGCSLLAQHPSTARGLICGAAALCLGLYTEWHFRPFAADDTFTYFVHHLNQLTPVTYLMIGVGTIIAAWIGGDAGFGMRRDGFRKTGSVPDKTRSQ